MSKEQTHYVIKLFLISQYARVFFQHSRFVLAYVDKALIKQYHSHWDILSKIETHPQSDWKLLIGTPKFFSINFQNWMNT